MYEVMGQFLHLKTEVQGFDGIAAFWPALQNSLPWHCCDNRTSRAISHANHLEIVKLQLPAEMLECSPNKDKTMFQLIATHHGGVRLFLNIGLNLQLVFRPLPIFHVNVLSTVCHLTGDSFQVRFKAHEETTVRVFDIAIRIPNTSTVEKAWVHIANAAIDEAGIYRTSSENKRNIVCDVQQFKHIRSNCLALPILDVAQRKRPIKKLVNRDATANTCPTKKRIKRHASPKTQKKTVKQNAASSVKVMKKPMTKCRKK